MKDEFPEFMEPEIPQGAAGLIEVMKRIHKQPDSREYEWANVMEPVIDKFGIVQTLYVESRIQGYLSKGYALNQMLKIKDGIIYWQGARLRKPEGES